MSRRLSGIHRAVDGNNPLDAGEERVHTTRVELGPALLMDDLQRLVERERLLVRPMAGPPHDLSRGTWHIAARGASAYPYSYSDCRRNSKKGWFQGGAFPRGIYRVVVCEGDRYEAIPQVQGPGEVAANQGKATVQYFQSVDKLFMDLKGGPRRHCGGHPVDQGRSRQGPHRHPPQDDRSLPTPVLMAQGSPMDKPRDWVACSHDAKYRVSREAAMTLSMPTLG
jgi:hypothetical protein